MFFTISWEWRQKFVPLCFKLLFDVSQYFCVLVMAQFNNNRA